jgi:hypothetical protein
VTATQKSSTTAIVQAVDRVGGDLSDVIETAGYNTLTGLDWITGHLQEINSGIQELLDFLSWSHSEVIWRMEKQISLLTGIRDMLKNPRATQADELFKMGVDSFRRGRSSEAVQLLKEARELNPGDYRVLVTLGHTYAHTDNLPAALAGC